MFERLNGVGNEEKVKGQANTSMFVDPPDAPKRSKTNKHDSPPRGLTKLQARQEHAFCPQTPNRTNVPKITRKKTRKARFPSKYALNTEHDQELALRVSFLQIFTTSSFVSPDFWSGLAFTTQER